MPTPENPAPENQRTEEELNAAANPLLDAMERTAAMGFLNHGHKPDGYNLDDPAIRAERLDGPKPFVSFQVLPVPADIAELIAQARRANGSMLFGPAHEAACQAADDHYRLAPRFYATLDPEDFTLWIKEN